MWIHNIGDICGIQKNFIPCAELNYICEVAKIKGRNYL